SPIAIGEMQLDMHRRSTMAARIRCKSVLFPFLLFLFFVVVPIQAQNQVMGEVEFNPATKVEKHAGVWVDGQYVGFAEELKGDKKVMLLPGEHELVLRQDGYKQIMQRILIEPGQKLSIPISMEPDPQTHYPSVTARIKLKVEPDRAAVFVDDRYVGNVHQFGGVGRSMIVGAGKHRIKIALAGFQTFETEVNLLPNQKLTLKAKLETGSINQASPLIKKD
ncbi:MAG: PEGA domain-containing protein, partial [Candidatus Acidiferrales bacterium]